MRYHTLPGTDISVSALCLSAANFGIGVDVATADRLLGIYREAGGNFIDTAHCYCAWLPEGNGSSETAFGACLQRNGCRGELVIGTKGGHPTIEPYYLRDDDFLSAKVISADIDDSLARMGIETIDLYWLHRDDGRTPVAEIIGTLNKEITRGRIRALGASNWSTARMAEANAYAAAHGLHGFAASQPMWNLAQPNTPIEEHDPTMRYLTEEDVAWHRDTKLPVVAYTPTAGGYFATGRRDGAFDNDVSRARLDRVEQLASELGCTPNQLALAYLMCHDFPAIPILGTSNPEHLVDALGAVDVALTQEQIDWLRDGVTAPTPAI